jgi:hypothetical protein
MRRPPGFQLLQRRGDGIGNTTAAAPTITTIESEHIKSNQFSD